MYFSYIFLLLLSVPLLEIAVFVVIGGQIGIWATLGFVLLTAIIGSLLLRWQSLSLFASLKQELDAGRLPAKGLVRGLMLLVAGLLLLTPGFVTDMAGFLLFLPPVQEVLWRLLKGRILPYFAQKRNARAFHNDEDAKTVDLDPDEFTEQNPSSPWTETPDKEA